MIQIDDLSMFFYAIQMFHNLEQEHQQRETKLTTTTKKKQ